MSRIDANVATQVADIARPAQVAQERSAQNLAAQVHSLAPPRPAPVAADDLRAAAAQIKQVVESATSRKLAFEIDDTSGSFYVEVRDLNSGDVIKQIPSEEILKLRERLDELIGIFLDTEA